MAQIEEVPSQSISASGVHLVQPTALTPEVLVFFALVVAIFSGGKG